MTPHLAGPLLTTSGLRKEYGRQVALQSLDLEVHAGEIFGFLGPNGAGKTTAVKLLTGLTRPTSGSGLLFGKPLGDVGARRDLGFLPELFRYQDWLSPLEVLALHARLAGLDTPTTRKRTGDVLELVGLADRGRDRVGTFSKGMQQRLGLAVALLHEPRLVILDEPTSALDPLGRRDVREIIVNLKNQGVAVFLNSHLLSEVELVCDRVAIIHHGRVVRQGTVADLLFDGHVLELRLAGLTEATLISLPPAWKVAERSAQHLILGVPDDTAAPEVVRFLVAAGVDVYELRSRRNNLESVFLELIEGDNHDSPDFCPANAAGSLA